GNANAGTGNQGMQDAREMAALTASALGLDDSEVIVCSTGHIGDLMPMDAVSSGIKQLAGTLSRQDPDRIARGIMTTDTVPKQCAVELEIGGQTVHMGGICKGAGMICPDMATMLACISTDAGVAPGLLQQTLNWCVERSFNCISVDGSMSTNDTVAVLANGASGAPELAAESDDDFETFRDALLFVTQSLARQIVRDGEGATKMMSITVSGAESFVQARQVARKISTYNLVKTMLYGGDFNWGRIVAAMGASLVPFDPDKCTVTMAGVTAFEDGQVQDFDVDDARRKMQQGDVDVQVDLNTGGGEATVWTCDLTPEYVHLNAEYDASDLAGGPDD
ncbi:MAG: bifunctional glutamate N-acetyltransferase/amino-acid acetyltransferase ArgJ, partial [Armatimonadota bacterium]